MLILALAGCGDDASNSAGKQGAEDRKASIGALSAAHLISPDANQWLSHGRDYSEKRHSPLDQINSGNIDALELTWFYDLNTERGIEATPLVIDGAMYTTGSWSKVYALDAATGRELWTFDPEVPKQKAQHACCDVVNRGLAAWGDRLFLGTLDGRLIALERNTGAVAWSVKTFDPSLSYTITGAPRVVKGKVIIGNGGADLGVRGYVSAYNAMTGALDWRFYTVPGNPENGFENDTMANAAKTWTGQWWKFGGGGTVWDSMAFDPELNLLYVGVGNGSPWDRDVRSPEGGDNLFLSSIVALNPDTGEYVWHYQTTPGDSWDYTATQHMILADLNIDGEVREVIMQAPKNGFFYVLDRRTGEFISADNYVPVNWASHIDAASGRPVETQDARYKAAPHFQKPAPFGGHNWHPMAFNEQTGLVYIPALDIPFAYLKDAQFKKRKGTWNTAIDNVITGLPDNRAQRKAMKALLSGALLAWDPVTQQEIWRFDHIGPWNGGLLSTAGNLVFQGTADGNFTAYNATTGAKLWSREAQTGIVAAPISYQVDGEQYVAVMAGWGGVFPLTHGHFAPKGAATHLNRVLVYKLNGKNALPEMPSATSLLATKIPKPPAIDSTTEQIANGKAAFAYNCMYCHGASALGGGLIPDLRHSSVLATQQGWKTIVHDGALASKGMGSFSSLLSEQEIENIRHYVASEALTDWQLQQEESN